MELYDISNGYLRIEAIKKPYFIGRHKPQLREFIAHNQKKRKHFLKQTDPHSFTMTYSFFCLLYRQIETNSLNERL